VPSQIVTESMLMHVNHLLGTLKSQNNGRLYSDTVIGTLAVDAWAVSLRLVQRGGAWAGCGPTQSPHRCIKGNNPPINGQCTNFISRCGVIITYAL